ncbi:hypothetical protein AB0J68_21715, partial [Micromonospora sp. NPDC049580]|uniref:hypothetical protein n=1 Tax=Micromonospora sp. NPDC049580 TaxID=3154832 RepID=UPI00344973D5
MTPRPRGDLRLAGHEGSRGAPGRRPLPTPSRRAAPAARPTAGPARPAAHANVTVDAYAEAQAD